MYSYGDHVRSIPARSRARHGQLVHLREANGVMPDTFGALLRRLDATPDYRKKSWPNAPASAGTRSARSSEARGERRIGIPLRISPKRWDWKAQFDRS